MDEYDYIKYKQLTEKYSKLIIPDEANRVPAKYDEEFYYSMAIELYGLINSGRSYEDILEKSFELKGCPEDLKPIFTQWCNVFNKLKESLGSFANLRTAIIYDDDLITFQKLLARLAWINDAYKTKIPLIEEELFYIAKHYDEYTSDRFEEIIAINKDFFNHFM